MSASANIKLPRIARPPDELDDSVPNLKHLGGAKSDKWNLHLCNQVLNAAWYRRNDTPQEKGRSAYGHPRIFGGRESERHFRGHEGCPALCLSRRINGVLSPCDVARTNGGRQTDLEEACAGTEDCLG